MQPSFDAHSLMDAAGVQELVEIVGEETVEELYGVYISTANTRVEEVLELNSQDADAFEKLGKLAHSLKGDSASLKLNRMFEVSLYLDMAYKEKREADAWEAIPMLPTVFEATKEEIIRCYPSAA